MTDFEVYIDDDRYSVPSFYLIAAPNEAGALAAAEQLWRSSEHHHGVELRQAGERVCGLGSMAASHRAGVDADSARSL
ncbi:MAG: hypothetical protein ACREEW_04125 [Caulobacteraceae bacterium]